MEFDVFKKLHEKFTVPNLPRETWYSKEYDIYIEAFHENKEFSNWVLAERMNAKGFDHKDYCCIEMAFRISDSLDEKGEIDHDEVDVVMNKWDDGTFGIPIHDGGTSVIKINYCPWCGTRLNDE